MEGCAARGAKRPAFGQWTMVIDAVKKLNAVTFTGRPWNARLLDENKMHMESLGNYLKSHDPFPPPLEDRQDVGQFNKTQTERDMVCADT
jgi:hypothetical protein